MRNLFRAFEREGVRQLLIGGQAAILYGAAYFTQDLDFWVEPSPANLQRFLKALARLDARVHKLTPPVTTKWARRGHGFHFTLKDEQGRPAYLDAMGCPPRSGTFAAAERRRSVMPSPWGRLAVVSMEDLVELKKTNRPGDYEVISRLARIRLGGAASVTPRLARWACENCFRIDDLAAVVEGCVRALAKAPPAGNSAPLILLRSALKGRSPASAELERAARLLDRKLAEHLAAGRDYWTPRIAELRRMRAAGGLLPEGMPVCDLLR